MALPCASKPSRNREEPLVTYLTGNELVEATVASRLRASGYPQVQRVTCEFREGVLTLRGEVSSYYLKQVVQALVFGMDDVAEVNNRVEVIRPSHLG